MKKYLLALVLYLSTTGKLFSQSTQKKDLFDVPASSTDRMYVANLGSGNHMQVEFSDMTSFGELRHIDSLLLVFAQDMEPLRDSLSNELNSRYIEYLVDSRGTKKIRTRQTSPLTTTYVISKGVTSLLKLSQDTIVITVIENSNEKNPKLLYYRVSFYLNDLNSILEYQGGKLREKISSLEKDQATKWTGAKPRPYQLRNDPDVTTSREYGYIHAKTRTYLFRLSVDVQNYKNYFVPSATLSMILRIKNNNVIREFGFMTETHFFFAKNSSGKLETFPNNILSFSYGRGAADNASTHGIELYPYISLGYLIKKKGNFFEDNTIKLGLGRFTLFNGSTKIEPCFYIDNFYKRISPSLRILQYF